MAKSDLNEIFGILQALYGHSLISSINFSTSESLLADFMTSFRVLSVGRWDIEAQLLTPLQTLPF